MSRYFLRSRVTTQSEVASTVDDKANFPTASINYSQGPKNRQRKVAEPLTDANSIDDEEDPMLKVMPGTNGFKAYVRADIATFYGEDAGSRVEAHPQCTDLIMKFVNMSPDRVTVYWMVGATPHFLANADPWDVVGATTAGPPVPFTMTKPMKPDEILCNFSIVKGTAVYFYNPFAPNDPEDPGRAVYQHPIRSLAELEPHDGEQYDARLCNLDFASRYKNFTGGSEWLSMYPTNPPRHKMWRADYLGQTHAISTQQTHFVTIPPPAVRLVTIDGMKSPPPRDLAGYRAPGPSLNLTLRALSCAPRIFEVRHFLSEAEADHIVDVAQQRQMQRSMAGQGEVSNTRETWIPRRNDAVLNAVYRRAADVLRINEALFRKRCEGEVPEYDTLKPINERLQIIHSTLGQEVEPHHDFGLGYPSLPGTPSRSINFCFYLNNVPKGGYTSFPRWRNAESGAPLEVVPEKTKALIFYMIQPDGNLDDLTRHAGKPVLQGEKWFATLLVHDPF